MPNQKPEAPYEPPFPKPLSKKDNLSFWQLLKRSRKSLLHIFFEGHYREDLPSFSLFRAKVYNPNNPEEVKKLLKQQHQKFPKHRFLAKMLDPLIGKGIFTTNGELWKQQRRIMDVGFEKAGLKNVFPLMLEAVEEMHTRLAAHPDGEDIDIDMEMTHVTADIIMRTTLSTPINTEESLQIFNYFEEFQDYGGKVNTFRVFQLPPWLSTKNYILWKRRGKQIRQFIGNIIKRRHAEFIHKGGDTSYGDILEVLMSTEDPETKKRFNRKELIDQVVTLFLAGHETSASALSWAFYILAHQSQHAEALQEEAQQVYGDTSFPDFRQVNKLKKTRDVFRETLRLYPPLSVIAREASSDCKISGREVKKNSTINICPWLIHRREKLWKDPHAFRPERFAEGENKKNQGTYLPFSLGPRICIGAGFAMQEAMLILSTVVKRYDLTPTEGHTPDPVSRLTLRSLNGVKVKLHKHSAARSSRPVPTTEVKPSGCPFNS